MKLCFILCIYCFGLLLGFFVGFFCSFFFFWFISLNHLQTACESLLALAPRRRNRLPCFSTRVHDFSHVSAPFAPERSPTPAAGRVALRVAQRDFRQGPDREATPVKAAGHIHTAQIHRTWHVKHINLIIFPPTLASRTDALLTSPSADSPPKPREMLSDSRFFSLVRGICV